MGNYRFKLSDLVSNSWFYKLKNIGNKPRNHINNNKKQTTKHTNSQQPKPHQQQFHYTSYARKSYHITRELNPTSHNSPRPEPPRKSSKQTLKRRIQTPRSSVSSVSASCSCHATLWTKSNSPADSSLSPDSDSSPESDSDMSNKNRSNANDVDKEVIATETDRIHVFDKISDLDLPPIITKPINGKIAKNFGDEEAKNKSNSTRPERNAHSHGPLSVKIVKEQNKSGSGYAKKHPANSPGVRLRINSPRIATRKCYQGRTSLVSGSSSRRWSRSVSDSLAIVKTSVDPQRDFKESMVEMIVENNLTGSKDLEELLAAYLSLNSDEYHHLIIKVFKQIWFDVTRK